MSASELHEWWVHRVTWSDGQIETSRLGKGRPGQQCFAGMAQALASKRDPGAIVEHIVLARVETVVA